MEVLVDVISCNVVTVVVAWPVTVASSVILAGVIVVVVEARIVIVVQIVLGTMVVETVAAVRLWVRKRENVVLRVQETATGYSWTLGAWRAWLRAGETSSMIGRKALAGAARSSMASSLSTTALRFLAAYPGVSARLVNPTGGAIVVVDAAMVEVLVSVSHWVRKLVVVDWHAG